MKSLLSKRERRPGGRFRSASGLVPVFVAGRPAPVPAWKEGKLPICRRICEKC